MAEDRSRDIARLSGELRGIVVRSEPRYRLSYSFDATGRRGECGGVVFPASLGELERVVSGCARLAIPVFMRGAGSGFTGGSVPLGGGLVVSMEKLRRVLSFDAEREEVEVECGIVNRELQDFLEPRGYFYPPDPASLNFSTIGGNIAENAGGPRAFRYGVTRRYVRAITWVTPAGRSVEAAPPVGVTGALVGAEGTLGAIYSARLGVSPLPAARLTALIEVGVDRGALAFAAGALAAGLAPSVLEFIDSKTMRCVSEYCCFGAAGRDANYLFIEIEGSSDDVSSQARLLESLAARALAVLRRARSETERELLWKVRRSVSPSLARRGVTKVNEDVSLPLGKLEEAARFIHETAQELDLDCYVYGHAGDGNMHVNIMTDRRRAEEMRRASSFVERLFARIIELGGTLSGEHGIGLSKGPYLPMIFTPAELALARGIKRAVDAEGIMNPGKYFTYDAPARVSPAS